MTIKKQKDCMQLYVNQILTYNLGTASHKHLKYFFVCEDTENIGILELHVIPNVCSAYSEQN